MSGLQCMVHTRSVMFSILIEHLAVDFFNHLNMLYGTVTEFCTVQEACLICQSRGLSIDFNLVPDNVFWSTVRLTRIFPSRTLEISIVLHRYEYLWEDGSKYKRPTKLPAPQYVDALMNWAQGILDDENVFPNENGKSSPISPVHLLTWIRRAISQEFS